MQQRVNTKLNYKLFCKIVEIIFVASVKRQNLSSLRQCVISKTAKKYINNGHIFLGGGGGEGTVENMGHFL